MFSIGRTNARSYRIRIVSVSIYQVYNILYHLHDGLYISPRLTNLHFPIQIPQVLIIIACWQDPLWSRRKSLLNLILMPANWAQSGCRWLTPMAWWLVERVDFTLVPLDVSVDKTTKVVKCLDFSGCTLIWAVDSPLDTANDWPAIKESLLTTGLKQRDVDRNRCCVHQDLTQLYCAYVKVCKKNRFHWLRRLASIGNFQY